MLMINRNDTSSITQASTVMGILMDNELLLLEAVQGKRVLRSLQLPTDVSEPGRLLKDLWDAGLDSAWVMPATTRSRIACTGYFAHPFEDLQLRLPCLPLLLPHELAGERNSVVLLTLQRNNLNPMGKNDVSSQNTL